MFIPAPLDRVFEALDTDEGRASFWAQSAISSGTHIDFKFINGHEHKSKILERRPPNLFSLDYFGGKASFKLEETVGGTELLLTHEGVKSEEWIETHAGWLNVLFPLKARVAFGVDLRNNDASRTWEQGYADQ